MRALGARLIRHAGEGAGACDNVNGKDVILEKVAGCEDLDWVVASGCAGYELGDIPKCRDRRRHARRRGLIASFARARFVIRKMSRATSGLGTQAET